MAKQLDFWDENPATTATLTLPPLPSLVRYYDQFDQIDRVLRDISSCVWTVHHSGSIVTLDFRMIGVISDPVIIRVVLDYIENNQISTALKYYTAFSAMDFEKFTNFKELYEKLSPPEFRMRWSEEIIDQFPQYQIQALRQVLHWLSKWSIGAWRPEDSDIIRNLPGFSSNKYKSVSSGSAFIPIKHRSQIVSYLDQQSIITEGNGSLIDVNSIRDLCLLVLAFQFGLRPLQMAMLTLSDVRIFDKNTVHISVSLIKQRHEKVGRVVKRKIQASWCPIFHRYRSLREIDSEKFLGLRPEESSRRLSSITKSITGVAYSPNHFRHTSAQRLVDHGASREVVSDFLGHTDTTAANVYFEASPTQNDLVNAALGNSAVYQAVSSAQRGEMISVANLLRLAPDQQVVGMPHGVPISGIGACSAGQSTCSRNPVLACYTCHKFLPVNDATVHQSVRDSLEVVVMSYDQPQRVDRVSPAMMQLRSTLESVSAIIEAAQVGERDA